MRERLNKSFSYQSSHDSCSSNGDHDNIDSYKSKDARLIDRIRAALARFVHNVLMRLPLCCVPPSDYEDMDWGWDEGVVTSAGPPEDKMGDYTVCSLVSDLGSNITVYFRSEEPVSLTMDISTGHTVLVCYIIIILSVTVLYIVAEGGAGWEIVVCP